MSLVAIGMNHKTASLDIREKISVNNEESSRILKKLYSMPIIDEVFLISTCNRTEIYCEMDDLNYVEHISAWLLKQKGMYHSKITKIIFIVTQIAQLLSMP